MYNLLQEVSNKQKRFMKSILDYSYIKARRFFLKEESYFNADMPPYFIFEPLLKTFCFI